jgi:biotin operon repressor
MKWCYRVEKISCYICGKETLSKSEIGLTKKLLDNASKRFYCLDCLAEYLEIDTEFLHAKIEELKEQGCKLF